jgi:hypothetical protein
MIGVTYAATKDLTIGLVHSNNDIDGTVENEKIKSLQVGYNLGPVVIAADYSMFEGIGGSAAATAEGKQLGVRLSTRF